MSNIIPEDCMPPENIVKAAAMIGKWFAERNIESWALGPCASRSLLDDQVEQLKEERNAPYLSHAHCLCSDIGVPQSHINDRLLTAIQIFGRIKARNAQSGKALEFAEYMAKSGEYLLTALNNSQAAVSNWDENMCDETNRELDNALEVRAEAYNSLRNDIYEFRKRVPA